MKFIVPLRLPPTFRGHKIRFEFENWIHIFNPNVSIKKISEIFKNPKFFRKNVFSYKSHLIRKVSQSRTRANLWGNFHGNRSCWGSYSCCSHNLFTSRTLKIHSWKLFVYGKIFAHGKIKSGRKSLVKRKEKESRPKEEKRVPFCQDIVSRGGTPSTNYGQEKKNIPLWKWLLLAELHAGVQISIKEVPVEQKFAKHAVKNEVSFSLC